MGSERGIAFQLNSHANVEAYPAGLCSEVFMRNGGVR